jgi:16S rRNA G966 N2-methylase RsmD
MNWRDDLWGWAGIEPGGRPLTVIEKDQAAIASALLIHTNTGDEKPHVLDATYNIGNSWKGLPFQPWIKADLYPQAKDVQAVNWNDLAHHFWPAQFDMIYFDPPHQSDGGHNQDKEWVEKYRTDMIKGENIASIFSVILSQSSRILTPKGIVLFKISDQVHAQKQQMQHCMLWQEAIRAGWTVCDYQIKIRPSNRPDPKHKQVLHYGKNCSFFLILRHDGKC